MKLIFLAQFHRALNEQISIKTYDMVIRSQFAVAKYLQKHPTIPVLDESLLTYENYKRDDLTSYFIEAFPTGIPDKLEDLNSTQKEFFYNNGGTMVAYQLGYIRRVYGSLHPSMLKTVNENIAEYIKDDGPLSKLDDEIMYEREKEAMSCVQEVIFEEDPKFPKN